ncbi:DUF6603 domain-containing protein, partial [Streptomyces sp. NPDC090442]|uniref:DUF6603 domain-containing protein n=1 Tax=Streptomyces sp. NPDC090442 TaxID=3365962 RepID=UPI0038298E07
MWLEAGLKGAKWSVVDDWLSLSDTSVLYGIGWYSFDDEEQASSRRHLISQEINASLDIKNNTLDAHITLPSEIITASLQDPVNVRDIIGDTLGDIPAFDDVTVSSIFASGNLDNKSYTVSCSLDTSWEFFDGVTMTGVSLHLDGLGGPPDIFFISGSFDIAGTTVYVEARKAVAGGWMLSVIAEDLEFSGVCDWLESTFPGLRVPAAVSGTVLQRLALTFEPSTRTIAVSCTGSIPLGGGDTEALLDLHAQARKTGSSFRGLFWGELAIPISLDGEAEEPTPGEEAAVQWMRFTLSLDLLPETKSLGASWSAVGEEGVSVLAVLRAFGMANDDLVTVLPEGLWPVVREVGIAYDSGNKVFVLAVGTGRIGVVAASSDVEGTRSYAVLVRGAVGVRLSGLPLVGSAVPPEADVVLRGVEFTLASREWKKQHAEDANDLLRKADPESLQVIPRLPEAGLKPGVRLVLDVDAPGEVVGPLVLPLTSPGVAEGSGSLPTVVPAAAGVPGVSFDVGVRLGPVSLHRITVGYEQGLVRVGFDASMAVGPVALTLLGLGVSVDPASLGGDALAEPAFAVESRVEGAQVLLYKPPVRVSGGLMRRKDDAYAELITGGIAVEAQAFALQAAGSYARSHEGWNSLFLFGEAFGQGGTALFGPPPFTVIGLSLGFGVNSTVRVPELGEMDSFPLMARLGGGQPGTSPEQILEQLKGWISPKQGQYWGMGGVLFTSFRFIESQALLLIEGGEQWNVTLLGRTSLALPRGSSTPAARVNIDLLIAYRSEQNLLSLDAVIAAGSYILDPGFTLSGGIALRVWTGDDHAGDFALSAGGYHPGYEVRKRFPYYPEPARLGFSWSPGGGITATGSVYGAVTSNAMMFGGRLALDYAAGGVFHLQAWMDAKVDVLVQWKPFYFNASIGVRVGAAATVKVWFIRVRVSVEVGVDLDIWGPP